MEPNIVFFDGVCGLCNGFVDFVMRIDKKKSFQFAPLQGAYARQHLPAEDVTDLKTVVVRIDGKIYKKSEAVLKVFSEIGGAWGPFKYLHIIPESLRDKAYDGIASNRYSLFGKKESCRLPTPEERSRFLL